MLNLMRFPLMSFWILAVLLCTASSAYSQTQTRAFYYDGKGNLLQIEKLDGLGFPNPVPGRMLQDISEFRIPRMTSHTHLDPVCTTEGQEQQMSKWVNFAIYYGVDSPNDSLEKLRPLNLEYLKDVSRNLSCVPLNDDAGCPQGTRCLTTCASCAGYCCVR